MVKVAHSEENIRLDVAYAAMQVSGTAKDRLLVTEIPAPSDRVYLYAVPEQDNKVPGFPIGKLEELLEKTDTPHLVDWSKESVRKGLRYIPDYIKVPVELKPFTSSKAVEEWKIWKQQEFDIDQAVRKVAIEFGRDPNFDIDKNRVPADIDQLKPEKRTNNRDMSR